MINLPVVNSDIYEGSRTSEFKPFQVIVHTDGSPVIMYDPIYLDNLLAWVVVQRATKGAGLADKSDAYRIELPVKRLWTSDEGYPLWAASCFFPLDKAVSGSTYIHRRGERHKNSGKPVGRFRDRRMPIPTVSARKWGARCYGDMDRVADLLRDITTFGKRRAAMVLQIEVIEQVFCEVDMMISDGALLHALPEGSVCSLGLNPKGAPVLVGWTPPQWKPSLFSQGWSVSTKCSVMVDEVDFFEVAEKL